MYHILIILFDLTANNQLKRKNSNHIDEPMETNIAEDVFNSEVPLNQLLVPEDPDQGPQHPNNIFHPTIEQSDYIHAVVDTNVLIRNMDLIEKIIKEKEFEHVKIVLPWRIAQELDKLKKDENQNTAYKARRAIEAIENWAQNNCNKIVFQNGTEEEFMNITFKIESADDVILQLCINLQNEQKYQVMLLTYDKNLIIKARFFDITIFKNDSDSYDYDNGKSKHFQTL